MLADNLTDEVTMVWSSLPTSFSSPPPESLSLRYCSSSNWLQTITSLQPSLRSLSFLAQQDMGSDAVIQLFRSAKLEQLRLVLLKIPTNLLPELPSLRSLSMRDCFVEGAELEKIFKVTPNLQDLDLSGELAEGPMDDGIAESIAKFLSRLEALRVNRGRITHQGAIYLAKNLPHLKNLEISGNFIKDQGLAAIGKNLKELTTIHCGSNCIGDEGVLTLAKYGSLNLTEVLLSPTSHSRSNVISFKAMKQLVFRLRNLKRTSPADNNIKKLMTSLIPMSQAIII